MRLLLIIINLLYLSLSPAVAQVPVFDLPNTFETAAVNNNTRGILEKNAAILSTVNKTLEAMTGDRKGAAGALKGAATANSMSAGDAPSTADEATKSTIDLILKSMKTEFEVSGKVDNKDNKDPSLEAMAKTTIDMNTLIKGIIEATKVRRKKLEAISNNIGSTKDIKESIDQNSQLQVQNGLLLNEVVGLNNNILASNQTQNQRRVTDVFNTMKAMSYSDD